MPIIVSKRGGESEIVFKSRIESEYLLQKYIQEHPEAIPVYEIEDDLKILVVSREFPTMSGPIDALGIGDNGDIYIIETKLYRNPDKRLVISQAMDYGAALYRGYSNPAEFVEEIAKKALAVFGTSIEEKIQEFFEKKEDEAAELLENICRNLKDGRIKFIILMDRLHDRLKDLILFMNQNSQFDIYAVEVEFYRFEDYDRSLRVNRLTSREMPA